MSRHLKIAKLDSFSGRRALKRLEGRSSLVLDRRTLSKAKRIVDKVRRKGDDALLDFARELDGATAETVSDLRLRPGAEGDFSAPVSGDGAGSASGWGILPFGFGDALERAIAMVDSFHRPQVHPGYVQDEMPGVWLEERRQPLRRVGIYVPGGRASYPSTVLMTVIPARLAGVEEIVVATPPQAYGAMPALRYTLHRLGVEEIWGVGGAHAVAALAYGTEAIPRVDKIVGPGNAWVTAAKRLVVGDVAIDGLAGPTEVVVVAQRGSDPQRVAADLLAQAEHDPLAAAVLITDHRDLAKAVDRALEEQLPALATREVAEASLKRFGVAFVVPGMEAAAEVVDTLAPEHLQLVGGEAEALAPRIRNAGAIFLGSDTPEVFGDYIAGPSHVLPTCGSARFTSALGVEDFIRRSHVVRFSSEAARLWAGAAATLADAEGLPAHAASARRRSSS
ncbi:MAG: histidinol dehydrogenase [Acidobacteriota bacterium]